MRHTDFVRAIAVTLACLLLSGCGSSGRGVRGKVEGTATYKGKPIPSGKIVFEIPGARPANGTITDGKITDVTTYDPNDGVPVGLAKIAVFATDAPAASGPAPTASSTAVDPGKAQSMNKGANYMGMGAKSLIPVKYNDPGSSGLTWEIKKGNNQVVLELKD